MKAIRVEYRGATTMRPAKLIASDGEHSHSISIDHSLSDNQRCYAAAVALCDKMRWGHGDLIYAGMIAKTRFYCWLAGADRCDDRLLRVGRVLALYGAMTGDDDSAPVDLLADLAHYQGAELFEQTLTRAGAHFREESGANAYPIFTVELSGVEREDGEAGYLYTLHARDGHHAGDLARQYHYLQTRDPSIRIDAVYGGRVVAGSRASANDLTGQQAADLTPQQPSKPDDEQPSD